MLRICKHCQKVFEGRVNAKYCKNGCRVMYCRALDKACVIALTYFFCLPEKVATLMVGLNKKGCMGILGLFSITYDGFSRSFVRNEGKVFDTVEIALASYRKFKVVS